MDELNNTLEKARAAGDSDEGIQHFQHAIRIADASGLKRIAFLARMELLQVLRQLLRSDLMAETFVRALADYDESPEEYSEFDPLFAYRETLGLIANFPTTTRQKFDELASDYKSRLLSSGESDFNVHELRWAVSVDFASQDMATEARDGVARNLNIHGHPYFVSLELNHWQFFGNDTGVVNAAQSMRDLGMASTVASCVALLPLLRSGSASFAKEINSSQKKMRSQEVYYWPYGEQFKYWAIVGELDSIQEHYPALQRVILCHSDPLTRLYFFTDLAASLAGLQAQNCIHIEVDLPDSIPIELEECGARKRVKLADLVLWMDSQAKTLADEFDGRNGNDYFKTRIEAAKEEVLQLVKK